MWSENIQSSDSGGYSGGVGGTWSKSEVPIPAILQDELFLGSSDPSEVPEHLQVLVTDLFSARSAWSPAEQPQEAQQSGHHADLANVRQVVQRPSECLQLSRECLSGGQMFSTN